MSAKITLSFVSTKHLTTNPILQMVTNSAEITHHLDKFPISSEQTMNFSFGSTAKVTIL